MRLQTTAKFCSVEENGKRCDRPSRRYGMCNMHSQRMKKRGDPLLAEPKRLNGEWLKFLEQASKATTDNCIEGGGKVRPMVHPPGSSQSIHASRYVWILANGDPGDLFVLHTCDNALCVNIRHLYVGDQARNMQDVWERNRKPFVRYSRGEAHYAARLTEDSVREIRQLYASGMSQEAIAPLFGVSQVAISAVVRRKTWKHVT